MQSTSAALLGGHFPKVMFDNPPLKRRAAIVSLSRLVTPTEECAWVTEGAFLSIAY